jgi:hypothetical protein
MVSEAGLAPARVGLKGRLLELLCIHGQNMKLVPEVGIAPTSPPLQGGANLPQLLGDIVLTTALSLFTLHSELCTKIGPSAW